MKTNMNENMENKKYEKYYWANDEARLFLSRGYITETVEQRVKDMANRAESILKIDGFADKFEEYTSKGYYSLSTPVWINFGKQKGLPISCVSKDTWINTINGGKMAKDIEIGDMVLTHKNRFMPVTQIMPTSDKGDIYKLKVGTRLTNLYVTGNHPILTNLGWVKVDELDVNKHLIAVNGDIEYLEKEYVIDLKEFVDYEYVVIDGKICKKITNKVPHKIKNNKSSEFVTYYSQPFEHIEMDEDLAWAFGLWFAEGSLSKTKYGPNGIRITINSKDEVLLGQKWLEIMTRKFNLNGNEKTVEVIRNEKINTWRNVNINSKILGNFFASFGDGCKNKQLPDWFLTLPKNLLQAFIDGILLGDGTPKRNAMSITLSNPKLILQVYNISLKLKKEVSLQMQEKAGKLATTKYVYNLTFRNYSNKTNKNHSNSGIKFNDGLIYCPIITLEKTDLIDDVYDFTVEEDHSFSCNGVIVHNCYGSNIEDSLDSILNASREIGMMSKYGGGTSAYLGNIRPRGAVITTGGKADGPVHYARLYDTTVDVCKQSEARRGACAVYLPIEHDDIDEFLDIGTEGNPIQNLQFGITITNKWLEDMKNGDSNKRKIWAKVIQRRSEFGFPYIMFKDNSNDNTPYKELGLEITASNLCLTEDQRVVTSKGYLTVKELYESGEELVLFSGNEAVKSSPMLLRNEDAEILKITYSNGMTQKVTFNHGIPVLNDTMGKIERVEAKDLKIGDYVALQTEKGLFGDLDMQDEAYLLGLYQSDGTQTKDELMIDVWENDFDLVDDIQEKFNKIHYKYGCDTYGIKNQTGEIVGSRNRNPATFHDCKVTQSLVKKKRLTSRSLKKALNFEKGYVPSWIWESNEDTIWAYLKGLLYADGTVSKSSSNGEPIQIVYSDINKEFLSELQILFTNLGLSCSIHLLRKEGERLLPDGKGGHKYYTTKDCWRLIFGSKNDALIIENKTQFLSRKNVIIEGREYRDNTKKRAKVVAIEQLENESVYCPTVDNDEHIFVSNGLRTFNCSEIQLPTDSYNSFVCCLGSINLLHWDEIVNTDAIEVYTLFLNAVIDEFISKSVNMAGMKRAWRFATHHRAIGVGVLGYHSLLQSKLIPFESLEAKSLNNKIFKVLKEKTDGASQWLYQKDPEKYKTIRDGYANTTLVAIAPTKSSSFILGQVSMGIEPIKSNYFVKDLAKIRTVYKNPYLIEELEKYNMNNDDIWYGILKMDGSVQHLDLPTKEVFKTFVEITPKEIILQAAQRQKYIDQSQSLNLMIDPSIPAKDINKLYLFAHEEGVKTLYYQFSKNSAQAFARDILNCVSCES